MSYLSRVRKQYNNNDQQLKTWRQSVIDVTRLELRFALGA